MATPPSVVLHLGAHKTATSLLQEFLLSRRGELQQLGAVALRRSTCDELVGWGDLGSRERELLRSEVLASADGAHRPPGDTALGVAPRTVILSHENALGRPFHRSRSGLYPRAGTCARGLAASVGDLTTRVVYYIRSQEEFLESYYLQTIHQGSSRSFEDWIGAIDAQAISWVPVVEKLERTFGSSSVIVRDFAEIRSGQEAFIQGFLRSCGLAPNRVDHIRGQRNISISGRGLNLALAVNPRLTNPTLRNAFRWVLQQYFNNTTGARPVLLPDEDRVTIRQRYAAENADLLARFRTRAPEAG